MGWLGDVGKKGGGTLPVFRDPNNGATYLGSGHGPLAGRTYIGTTKDGADARQRAEFKTGVSAPKKRR